MVTEKRIQSIPHLFVEFFKVTLKSRRQVGEKRLCVNAPHPLAPSNLASCLTRQ